jgi:hypothetical protein
MKSMDYQPTTHVAFGVKALMTTILIGFAKWLQTLQNVHIPPIFVESLMCLSYLGGIIIASIGIYKFIKERKNNGGK